MFTKTGTALEIIAEELVSAGWGGERGQERLDYALAKREALSEIASRKWHISTLFVLLGMCITNVSKNFTFAAGIDLSRLQIFAVSVVYWLFAVYAVLSIVLCVRHLRRAQRYFQHFT